MLPAKCRLTISQFRFNPSFSKVNASSLFIASYKPSKTGKARFAISVSKKLDKRAAKRNRIKRLISQWIYENIGAIKINLDVWIRPKKIINKETQAGFKKDLEGLLKKL